MARPRFEKMVAKSTRNMNRSRDSVIRSREDGTADAAFGKDGSCCVSGAGRGTRRATMVAGESAAVAVPIWSTIGENGDRDASSRVERWHE